MKLKDAAILGGTNITTISNSTKALFGKPYGEWSGTATNVKGMKK